MEYTEGERHGSITLTPNRPIGRMEVKSVGRDSVSYAITAQPTYFERGVQMRKRMVIAFATVCLLMIPIRANGPTALKDRTSKIKAFSARLMQYQVTHTLEDFYAYADVEGKKLKMKFVRPDSDEGKRLIESAEAKLKQLKNTIDFVVRPVAYRPSQGCDEACASSLRESASTRVSSSVATTIA